MSTGKRSEAEPQYLSRSERPEIDWSVFDKWPESECECRCEEFFQSHAKCAFLTEAFMLQSRKPCPGCGRSDNLRTVRSEPETMTISGKR